jgi:hypothetical protein
MTDSTVTPAQLREDAAWFRADVASAACKGCDTCSRYASAAAALEAQADALEARASDLHGWCVLRPDGTFLTEVFVTRASANVFAGLYEGARAVAVRLTTEGARAQEASDDE